MDYAVKLNGKAAFFIEVKPAGVKLHEKHIEQAGNYAANAGVSWVALTNGTCWQLYHLNFDDGIQSDLIMSADLLSADMKDACDKLSHLHKKSFLKGELEDYYARVKALSPKSIVQAIFQENTLRMIRGHLKRTSGITIEEDALVTGIKEIMSPETWKTIGDVKVKRKRKSSRPREGAVVTTPEKSPFIQEPEGSPTSKS
ncbi:MAG: type I restriction enzyme HsdR N-terminal domain-containing protein [Deltaproteobacteria bacterium]|nr:type I restriction enzyme HsdR N-terminal domain-containing protein [Deltaproteobacteria bacterium]